MLRAAQLPSSEQLRRQVRCRGSLRNDNRSLSVHQTYALDGVFCLYSELDAAEVARDMLAHVRAIDVWASMMLELNHRGCAVADGSCVATDASLCCVSCDIKV